MLEECQTLVCELGGYQLLKHGQLQELSLTKVTIHLQIICT